MDRQSHTITLYTSQTETVLQVLEQDGVCFSKEAYVRKKYEESAPIFLTAYSFFVQEAERLAPKPEGAEYPYWAFHDLYNVDASGRAGILKLRVPIEETVLFDVRDWNRILCLKYLGETEEEEKRFQKELDARGLTETKIMLTDFYPDWKREIRESWKRLFRHHETLCQGQDVTKNGIQAGLWRLKKEWIQ